MFRSLDTSLRFFLKGVQNINSLSKLHGYDYTVSVGRIPQSNLKNAAADSLERFGIFRHAAELDQLEFVTEQFLCTLRKILQAPFRVSQPDKRPQRGRFSVLQERT